MQYSCANPQFNAKQICTGHFISEIIIKKNIVGTQTLIVLCLTPVLKHDQIISYIVTENSNCFIIMEQCQLCNG
jgi:hypothetical protein